MAERSSVAMARERDDPAVLPLIILTVALILHAAGVLLASLDLPLLEAHGFRQTQTANTVYWILEGGPLVLYETPVGGAPWAIPFEFPIFHWIVAVVSLLGVPLDFAGRLVSFLFLVACLAPILSIGRRLSLSSRTVWVFAVLFFACPLHIFWGRAFLIETCALFFALLFFSAYLAALARPTAWPLARAAGLGCLAILAKATTLPAFSFLAGLMFLGGFVRALRSEGRAVRLGPWIALSVVLVLPYPVGLGWIAITDAVKLANGLLGPTLRTENLHWHNYGSSDFRFSVVFWQGIVVGRILPDIYGLAPAFPVALVTVALFYKRWRIYALLPLICFFIPLVIFTGLHTIHNYYQVAIAVFLLAALAFGIVALTERLGSRPVVFVTAAVAALQLLGFAFGGYRNQLSGLHPFWSDVLAAAETVRDRTPHDTAVIVFGINWASSLHYYARRKGVAMLDIRRPGGDATDPVIDDPEAYLGGLALGAVVVCEPPLPERTFDRDAAARLAARFPETVRHGACMVHLPPS